MASPYTDWLAQLAQDGQKGVPLPAISRGQDWAATLALDGDHSGSTFTCHIDHAPNSDSSALASPLCTVGAYDAGADSTPLTLSLVAAQTGAFPADGDADGLVWLLYEITRDGLFFAGGEVSVRESVY